MIQENVAMHGIYGMPAHLSIPATHKKTPAAHGRGLVVLFVEVFWFQ
jgi:hypothetical protein